MLQCVPKFVINLDRRTDRYLAFDQEQTKLFDSPPIRVSAIEDSSFIKGCAASHLSIITEARQQAWPFVLIMEDDCTFRPGSRLYAESALSHVPDCDIALGGLYNAAGLYPINEYWFSVSRVNGLHFYIVFKSAYDIILKEYDYKTHLDNWYSISGLRMCVTRKMFALQHPGYSDNTRRHTDYTTQQRRTGIELL